MRLRAGDRYLFKGLDGETGGEAVTLAGRLVITLLSAMHDGHVVYRTTWPDGMGDVDGSMSVANVARMIEFGIWEPLHAEPKGTP